jgi:single-strand DNA-binding protein
MAILTGLFTLGRDAELRSTSNGDQVATLSLGYNYGRKGQDSKQPTQWVRVSLWGKLAEALHPYLLKGKQVDAVIEDVHIRTFDKQDGSTSHNLEGKVLKIELARGQRPDGAAPAPAPQQRRAPAPAPAHKASRGFDDMDDDIPF